MFDDDWDDDPHAAPTLLSRDDFAALDHQAIDALTQAEVDKLEHSRPALTAIDEVESEQGYGGVWEQHWITLPDSGRRALAFVYYHGDVAFAVTADGRKLRAFKLE